MIVSERASAASPLLAVPLVVADHDRRRGLIRPPGPVEDLLRRLLGLRLSARSRPTLCSHQSHTPPARPPDHDEHRDEHPEEDAPEDAEDAPARRTVASDLREGARRRSAAMPFRSSRSQLDASLERRLHRENRPRATGSRIPEFSEPTFEEPFDLPRSCAGTLRTRDSGVSQRSASATLIPLRPA